MIETLFTNRIGGVSQPPYGGNNLALHVGDDAGSVRENRTRLEMLVGSSQYMNQQHGNTVAVVEGISRHEPNADALVTAEFGIALGVLVADCVPLLLWDEVEHVVAAVHVGRKGLLNGLTKRVVSVMTSMGAETIQALMGPSICGRCYEVGREIHDEVVSAYPSAHSLTSVGTWALDLSGALADELIACGIKISRSPTCTVENSQFFSYRREGVTGRQAGFIWQ